MSIVKDKEQLMKECKDVSLFEGQAIVEKLKNELSKESSGIGLAANQIGIDAKVCIIKTSKFSLDLINPVIIEKHDLRMFRQEGCLSFPDEWLVTARYNDIVIKDLLHPSGVIATGLEAVVIQHEVGHLYGEIMHDYQITLPSGPNDKCWCKSGRKFKKCCDGKEIPINEIF